MFDKNRYFGGMPTWILALILTVSVLLALSACVISLQTRTDISAEIARLSSKLSAWEKAERLTPSQLVELSELKDACEKGNALLKKISQRETMRDRREATTSATTSDKDELRRRAGIIPGRPAPHQ
jgi:hypothetical protein